MIKRTSRQPTKANLETPVRLQMDAPRDDLCPRRAVEDFDSVEYCSKAERRLDLRRNLFETWLLGVPSALLWLLLRREMSPRPL